MKNLIFVQIIIRLVSFNLKLNLIRKIYQASEQDLIGGLCNAAKSLIIQSVFIYYALSVNYWFFAIIYYILKGIGLIFPMT